MMVATRPEPTVLPPSRFVGYKILLLLGVFQALFYLYYSKYALLFEVLKFFRTIVEPRMYKLMFIHPLVNLAEKYLMLVPCSQILLTFTVRDASSTQQEETKFNSLLSMACEILSRSVSR